MPVSAKITGEFDVLPSVQLSFPEDCMRISETCGACVCVLVREGCSYCTAFWPVWSEFCASLRNEYLLTVHCECSGQLQRAKHLVAASVNPAGHSTFPAVLVCSGDSVITLDVDSTCGLKELQLKILAALTDNDAASDADAYSEEYTPIQDLKMEEIYLPDDSNDSSCHVSKERTEDNRCVAQDDDDGETADKKNLACECRGVSAPVAPVETNDGVVVTEDVTPDEVLSVAAKADETHRVVILYFTNWCGHCQDFKPKWNECVSLSAGDGTKWLAVNCETPQGEAAAAKQNVRGFPSVCLHHRYTEMFDGTRSVDALLKFVRQDVLPPPLLRLYRGFTASV